MSGGGLGDLEQAAKALTAWARSTSKRDFALAPIAAFLDQPVRRTKLHLIGLVPMAAGFALYKLGGGYRQGIAGGGSGLSGPPPERLVTTGIYAYTRNPMYSGHVLYLFGLAILTQSPLAFLFALANIPWFDARVRGDEASLLERFGEPYAKYLTEVPRWGVSPARVRALLAAA